MKFSMRVAFITHTTIPVTESSDFTVSSIRDNPCSFHMRWMSSSSVCMFPSLSNLTISPLLLIRVNCKKWRNYTPLRYDGVDVPSAMAFLNLGTLLTKFLKRL